MGGFNGINALIFWLSFVGAWVLLYLCCRYCPVIVGIVKTFLCCFEGFCGCCKKKPSGPSYIQLAVISPDSVSDV